MAADPPFQLRTDMHKIIRNVFFAAWIATLFTALVGASNATAADRAAPIADVEVRTQADRPMHFYRDLVKGRVVAVNFVFTSCSSVCPLMGVRFAQTQRLLGGGADAAGIALISVSIDPATDTPQRLHAWADKMHAAAGWTLVTGAKSDIDALVQSLGASAADPASHAPLVLVIDDKHGGFRQRLDGLTEPATLARILRERAALH